ncbi:hypothetical protein COUCH_32850 [Couchioplanes caeruleus]|uniref:hypothetical protein n=1 Tax=Couchioplanes caeruleus TaxID=56438 RepID=UPI0020BDFE90|nr:hypothetical protein [Couchioplanes caeruleus]UQU63731.1 hypothetical protein COUCH_32850 [Couchioplanes caeruleus]
MRACLSEFEPLAGRSPTTLAPLIHEDGSTERYEDIPRIMPTWALRFHGRVHEYPRVPDRDVVPGLLGVSLEFRHDGYGPEVARVKGKRTRNLALLEQARRDEPDNPRWLFYLLRDGLWDMPGDEVADLCDRLLRADHPGPGDRNHASTYRRAGLAQACSRLAQLGDWPRVLKYCTDLDNQSPPASPDAVYFRGLHELHAGAGANPQGLLAAVRIRKNAAAVARSGLDTEGRPLDALIAGYLRELKGKEAANSYLALCRPWTDPFFDASRLRR